MSSTKETILAALETALKSFFDGGAATNQIKGSNIARWRKNVLTTPPTETPAITIIDPGDSTPEVVDSEYVRYLSEIDLHLLVKVNSPTDTLDGLNGLIADLQSFCDTATIDAALLNIHVAGVSSFNFYQDKNMADAVISLDLRHVRVRSAV